MAQGERDGLTGYRLGSVARRTQHRRVEGGVQEAAVRRAADALDVQLLQQCQLRAEWASVNWIHRQLIAQIFQVSRPLAWLAGYGLAKLDADCLTSALPLERHLHIGSRSLRKKCTRSC